jgi:hypothetical protein
MKEMHQIVHEGLEDVLDYLFESSSSSSSDLKENTTLHHKTNGVEGNLIFETYHPLILFQSHKQG